MITEEEFLHGREMARRRVSRYNDTTKEIIFAMASGFLCAIGMIVSVIYADKIDAFFHSILRFIWL